MNATQLPRPPSPGRLDTRHPGPLRGGPALLPNRALTLQLGVVLRLGQKEPGQRGQEQQGPHSQVWGRSAGTETQAELETSRLGWRGLPRTGPAPGAVPGKGFPAET